MTAANVDELLKNPVSFLDDSGPDDDIAISSRIRLARNLQKFPFPEAASAEVMQEVCEIVSAAACNSSSLGGENMLVFYPDQMNALDREILLERRLASRDFIRKPETRRLFVCPDESCSLMVNEEDQLRLQTIRPGSQLREVWKSIDAIDNDIGRHLQYAFDEQLGFLTSCPTNVGTGMRASVMLHLPGLVLTGQIAPTIQGINKLRLAVRGIFGEGSDNWGNLFQISNQNTLGESETKIIDELDSVIHQLIMQEKNARRTLLENNRYAILDHVGRSYGLLRHSYKLGFEEAMQSLSGLRIGVDMGLFSSIDIHKVNELFIKIGPAHLRKSHEGEYPDDALDIFRAALCRDTLRQLA
ncbi:MAG: ATP--guanido phosphotransferase [Lentisphaerae bacterium]|nr:ATP--guanido phosphotransferase [Lentisphaerota bacterium]